MGYFFVIILRYFQNLIHGAGIHLIFSVSGLFFLGFPTIINFSVYALAIAEKNGVPPYLAFVLAVLVCLLVSILFAVLLKKVSADSFSVLGLCSILAFEALAKSWDGLTNGVLGIPGIQRPAFIQSVFPLVIVTAVIGVIIIALEYLFLESSFGRFSRGYKEDPVLLETIGVSSRKVSTTVLIISCCLFSIAGIFTIWHIQFLDPNFYGISTLIEILTIGTLALRPRVRDVALATLFVVVLPEILRFMNFTANILGHVRLLIYSVLLIALLIKLAPKLFIPKRTV